MSPLNTLPLSTLSVLNDFIIRVVEVDRDVSTSTWMFVDARGTVRGLMEQIHRSITSDNELDHNIRLICTNKYGGSVFVSTPFPQESNQVRHVFVSNNTKLESFLFEYALVRFQVIPVPCP